MSRSERATAKKRATSGSKRVVPSPNSLTSYLYSPCTHSRLVSLPSNPARRSLTSCLYSPRSVLIPVCTHPGLYCPRSPLIYSRSRSLRSQVLRLPLRSNAFDAVICIAVMHHLSTRERRVKCLEELRRVVAVGGEVYVQAWALEQVRVRVGGGITSERTARSSLVA